MVGADHYILGEDLEVTKWVLRQSMLHIDCEGGLVHLATQLSTKCAVIFGPTPPTFYGYEQNINILPEKCGNCMGVHDEWSTVCFKGQAQPECMYSTTAEKVLKEVSNLLKRNVRTKRLKKCSGTLASFADFAPNEKDGKKFKAAVIGLENYITPFLLQEYGYEVVVFDPSFGTEANEVSGVHSVYLNRCTQLGIDARFSSWMSLPYQEEQFDLIYCQAEKLTSLEKEKMTEEILRLSKYGAKVCMGREFYTVV